MYVSNEDMLVLNTICSNLELENCVIVDEDIVKLRKIVDKLEAQRKKKTNYASKYISDKRKEDKTYAQSYETKNKMLGL